MIAVAVIARPGASTDACLAALAAAGAPAPHVVELTAPGAYAEARNRALQACAAEVLALVEDDVAVDPGWLDALHGAWSADGAARLGCVGGPLRAAFPGGRPAWLSDALLGTFALHDSAAGGFHGGNVTFRAAALRGVGGFWPARGHADGRDWLSEEHHAQRELERAGWARGFEERAGASRLIPADVRRREIVRRRARYGARVTLLGAARPRPAAARALVQGLAGAPVAAARGAGGLAVERLARAAENAGVLAAERIARADFEPAARSTPFRHSVPTGRPAPARRSRSTILLYHRVVDVAADPLGLAVAPARFAEQLAAVGDRVRTLDEIAAGAPGVAITFDDGYADNLRHALPALAAAGAPATFFVSTGHVDTGRAFWWSAAERLLRDAPPTGEPLRIALGGDERAWPARDGAEREQARAHLHCWLQPRPPEEIESAMAALAAWAGVAGDALAPPDVNRPLTVGELRELAAAPGIEIGAHGRRHRSLAFAAPAVREDEIRGSADDLEAWLGTRPRAFSYPFGVPGVDVDDPTIAAAREAGYALAVVNAPGDDPARADRLALPRRVAPDLGGDDFAAWLASSLRAS